MSLSRKVKAVASVGVLSSAVWASTYATFTDSGTADSTFTAGTVDLLLNSEVDDAYAFTALASSNLKPGDTVYAPLTVANNGTLGFTYTMASSSTNADTKALRDTLQLGAKVVANVASCTATGYSSSVTTVIAEAAIAGAAITSRSLAASASEVLCFRILLASSAGDALQAATTTTTMTFTATQS